MAVEESRARQSGLTLFAGGHESQRRQVVPSRAVLHSMSNSEYAEARVAGRELLGEENGGRGRCAEGPDDVNCTISRQTWMKRQEPS